MAGPATPGGPEMPEEPGTPDKPGAAEEPGGPDKPGTPREPEEADEPEAGARPWWAAPAPDRADAAESHPAPGAANPPLLAGEPGEAPDAAPASPPRTGVSTSVMAQPDRRRTPTGLAWAAAALLAIVILFALFFLGQRIGSGAAVVPTVTPTPTPSPTAAQPPGVHVWNTLFGGECLQPFTSPWDHDFTVVDCATPHTAQLVYRGRFDAKQTQFPGEKALSDQINGLCSAAGIVDLTAARDYPHLVVQGSYPITQTQWEQNPYYYCFVSSEAGQPLTANIAGPGPQATASPAPTAASAG